MYLKSLACVNACMGVTVVGVVSGSPVLPVLHLQSVLPLNLAPNHHSLLLFFYACRDLLESLLNSYLYIRLTHPHSACFCFTIYSVWSFQYWSSALVKELFSWLFSTLPKCHSACAPASRNTWKHWKHFSLQQSSWGFILLNVFHFSTFTHIWVFRVTLTHLTFSDSVSVTLRIRLLFRIRRSASLLLQLYASCINMSEGVKNIVN